MNKKIEDFSEKDLLEFIAVRLNNIEKTLVSIGVMINITLSHEQIAEWNNKMNELALKEEKDEI